jgi:hypothetical protein
VSKQVLSAERKIDHHEQGGLSDRVRRVGVTQNNVQAGMKAHRFGAKHPATDFNQHTK